MSRIQPAPAEGLFRKYVYREARKRFDRDLEPMMVMGHSKKLLLSVGGFELPLEKFKAVDKKLMALAELKAAVMVGCEFCIDIGAFISAREGVTDEQLLGLPRHREASCFSELETLVLDYAAVAACSSCTGTGQAAPSRKPAAPMSKAQLKRARQFSQAIIAVSSTSWPSSKCSATAA